MSGADEGIRQGISTAPEAAQAVAELHAAIALPDAGFTAVFCSPRYDIPTLERELSRRFAGTNVVGCTTAGEISHLGYTSGSLAGVSLSGDACFSVSRVIPFITEFQPTDAREIVTGLLQEISRAGFQPAAVNTFGFLLIDGLSGMEEQVTSALSIALGSISLFGGSTGDHREPVAPMVFHEGAFHANAAVLTLVHTNRPFKPFCTHHFVGGGPKSIVTGADPERRLVTELNGESAAIEYARLFNQNLEEMRSGKMALPPLMVQVGGSYYTRSVISINSDDSLVMACAIDEGVPLSLGRNTGMLSNMERVFADIRHSIGSIQVVLGADCLWRKLEVQSLGIGAEVQRLFGENRVIGFSSIGEQIGPMHVNNTLAGVAIGSSHGPLEMVSPTADEPVPHQLETENAKLRKTVRVLLNRIERSMNMPSDTFSLFQSTVLLEETVKKRTQELAELNRQLNQELTRRREIEAALLQAKAAADAANNSKTQFLAAISHDLQQPLNAARLLLGALFEESLSAGGRAQLGRIESALETAEEMLGDFLDVAKLDAGEIPHQAIDFAIGPLLAQLGAEYAPQARRRGFELRVVDCGAVVHTDRHLFQRVLSNFLANAVRYTQRGRVLLGCRRRGDKLSVEVWDTGVGIPADKVHDIFRPFCQLDDSHRPDDRSSGLGLTIVDRICTVLGLSVDLSSEEGRGSGFRVQVPRGQGERAATGPGPDHQPSPDELLAGQRVLALDADPAALHSLAAIIESWGCVPILVASPSEALAALSAAPHLIIADYHTTEGGAGLDRLRAAGRHLPPIQALLVSADSGMEIRREAKRHGYDFLAKPINPARLRSAITYLLCCSPPAAAP